MSQLTFTTQSPTRSTQAAMWVCIGTLRPTTMNIPFQQDNRLFFSITPDCGARFTLSITCSIYECHIGMSGEEPTVSTYTSFLLSVLPRIVAGGYNCVGTKAVFDLQVQIMAVVEHAYYASFGYHCNMFYAVSSRFGTPVDFKAGRCFFPSCLATRRCDPSSRTLRDH